MNLQPEPNALSLGTLLVGVTAPSAEVFCAARPTGPTYPGGGSNYGCTSDLATYDTATDARDAFDDLAKRSTNFDKLPLSLGDASFIGTFTIRPAGQTSTAGMAIILKQARLLYLVFSAGNLYPARPGGTFHQEAFVSAVREAANQL